MRIEVDQSGKVENTQTDTVLAFSDGISSAIVIPARLKRKWFSSFREQRKAKRETYLLLFSAGLFLLLKPHLKKNLEIVIDREYTGQETRIKAMLFRFFQKKGLAIGKEQLRFGEIGDDSEADRLALSVFREREKADRVIGEQELFAVLK